jgi:putative phosphoribosyl transferase
MFDDRKEAGTRLADKLADYKSRRDVLVLALPRGGVVVAYEIAVRLNLPLDVLVVRKIGFPGESELAIGAVSETGSVVLNENIIAFQRVSKDYLEAEIERQKKEIARRIELYRGARNMLRLEGKIIVLVDDGIATGATMKAAIVAVRDENISRLVVALPVAPPDIIPELQAMTDELICLETPLDFMAVGVHYRNFAQVTDQEVVDLLHRSSAQAA